MKNYYEILEISETASSEVIKAAYKTLVKKYHPDNCGKRDYQNKILEINEAYKVLSDEKSKKQYDYNLKQCSNKQDFTNSNKSTREQESNNAKSYCKTEKKESKKREAVLDFFKDIGKSVIKTALDAQNQYQNAYLDGLEMNDSDLIRKYRMATGYKKNGYAKAMESKGYLKKNQNGEYEATYKLKWFCE